MTTPTEKAFKAPKRSILGLLLVLFLAGAFGSIGVFFGQDAVEGYLLYRDAPKFQAMQGKITKASVESEGQNSLRPTVHFEYVVGGKTYTRDNRHTAIVYRDSKLASRALQQYSVNKPTTVYVDRKDPTRATLSPKVPVAPALRRGGFALVFLIVALVLIGTWFRTGKRQRIMAYAKHVERQRQEGLEAERKKRGEQKW